MDTGSEWRKQPVRLTEGQKRILYLLTEHYEDSKTCFGTNKVRQKFSVPPNIGYRRYDDNFLDVDIKKEYDAELDALKDMGLVTLKRDGGDVKRITLVNERYEDCCRFIGKDTRHEVLRSQREVFLRHTGGNSFVDRICRDQIAVIDSNKDNSITKDTDDLDAILRCIGFITENRGEILVREMSIAVLGDSKKFADRYKSRVCTQLLKYGDAADIYTVDDGDRKEDAVLASYGIVKNPTYVYFKGNGRITYRDGYSVRLTSHIPLAINSQTIPEIESVEVDDRCVMTVENIASYNRLRPADTFLIFLSGYSNTAKNEFIKAMGRKNPGKRWYHFGDIDPDGFHILENLRNKTGVDFEPFMMGTEELGKYSSFVKELTAADRQKSESLTGGRYAEVIAYMTDHGCKLEQEIISWQNPTATPA